MQRAIYKHLHTQGHSKENISQDNQSLPMYPLAPSKKRLFYSLYPSRLSVNCMMFGFTVIKKFKQEIIKNFTFVYMCKLQTPYLKLSKVSLKLILQLEAG